MTTFKCLTKLSFTNLNINNYDITAISQLYLIFLSQNKYQHIFPVETDPT